MLHTADSYNVAVSIGTVQSDVIPAILNADLNERTSHILWSHFFRTGKKLTVDISFVCVEEGQATAINTQSAAGTAAQHVERDNILERNTLWNGVYALMRCPGHPCKN